MNERVYSQFEAQLLSKDETVRNIQDKVKIINISKKEADVELGRSAERLAKALERVELLETELKELR